MARSYAPLYTSIWQDEDFLQLTRDAQGLYLFINSQPDISYCGVVTYHERQWAKRAAGLSTDAVYAALMELVDRGFVVFDEDTDEVWVVTFIKHNKVMEQQNLRKSATRQLENIHSKQIKAAVRQQFTDGSQTPSSSAHEHPAAGPSEAQARAAVGPVEGQARAAVGPVEGQARPARGVAVKINEPKPEPEPESSSSTAEPMAIGVDDDDERLEQAWQIIARRRRAASPNPVTSFERWYRKAVRADLIFEFGAEAHSILRAEPGITSEALADRLSSSVPSRASPSGVSGPSGSQDATARRRAEALASGLACPDCESSGLVITDAGAAHQCKSCRGSGVLEGVPA